MEILAQKELRYAGDNRLIIFERSYLENCLAPRCRLFASTSCRGFEWLGCSPIKAEHELGSERCKTVRSLSAVTIFKIRNFGISTKGACEINR